MNVYYQKYIKYKTKYLEIKYGAGKKKSKNKLPIALPASAATETPTKLAPSASAATVTPTKLAPFASAATATPAVLATPQETPKFSTVKTPSSTLSDASDRAYTNSTPKLKIQSSSLTTLINKKDDLVCLLSSCPSLSNYVITSRLTGTEHLYINFIKKGEKKAFAHFSFHYPADEVESDIYDMFVPNTFHLRLDKNRQIVFNLIMDQHEKLVLESKIDPQEIICIITEPNYAELIKIKDCLEQILNMPEYKGIITEPTARRLFEDN